MGTAVAQWLRCCATNQKVAGSIPDSVIGSFIWHTCNPSDRTMALGSTQPLTEMTTRRISWGVNVAGAKGWQPYHLPVLLSWNLGTLTSWDPLGHSRPVTGLLYLYLFYFTYIRTMLAAFFKTSLLCGIFLQSSIAGWNTMQAQWHIMYVGL
jgi:hypothetical protein